MTSDPQRDVLAELLAVAIGEVNNPPDGNGVRTSGGYDEVVYFAEAAHVVDTLREHKQTVLEALGYQQVGWRWSEDPLDCDDAFVAYDGEDDIADCRWWPVYGEVDGETDCGDEQVQEAAAPADRLPWPGDGDESEPLSVQDRWAVETAGLTVGEHETLLDHGGGVEVRRDG